MMNPEQHALCALLQILLEKHLIWEALYDASKREILAAAGGPVFFSTAEEHGRGAADGHLQDPG